MDKDLQERSVKAQEKIASSLQTLTFQMVCVVLILSVISCTHR